MVSNELLEQAFSQFGPVERAVVVVDARGRPTGRGKVAGATACLPFVSQSDRPEKNKKIIGNINSCRISCRPKFKKAPPETFHKVAYGQLQCKS